jgi:hypothetical protein
MVVVVLFLSDTLNIGMEFFIEEGLDLFLIIK